MVEEHKHNGIDSQKLRGEQAIFNAPQDSLSPADTNILSTGGANNLKTTDATILNNAITRIAELETKLQKLGFIR